MLQMWLLDRAAALREASARADKAYTKGPLAEAAARLAKVHNAAAELYEREAAAVERGE
jgi:hypothetical protein